MTSKHLFWNTSTIYIASAQSAIFMVLRIYHFATANHPNFMYCKSTNYFTTGNRLHNCLLCTEKLYNFQSPIWKHINNYFATAQKHNFWLLRINYLATAHLPIIYLMQIDQLFHHWKSSKYLITLHWKILWQLHIAYLETFRRFISLLRKAKFLGYYASIILLLRISNYLWTANWQIISRLEFVYIIVHCA